ncbi:MAG: addiction module protein [Bacteroidales bacterium]|nr:addiction module protein [Bacteroidales bacterium]
MTEIKDILKLSVDERIHLVQTIWDSIASEAESADISDEHKKILNDRLEAYKNTPDDNISWKEIDKYTRRKL